MTTNSHPKLRLVQNQWVDRGDGEVALLLQDRLGLGGRAVLVPRALAPMLALCDGTRSPSGIRTALELHTGLRLDLPIIEAALEQLDNALMLDNERYAAAYRETLDGYRSAPARPASLAGNSYPSDPGELAALLDGYLQGVQGENGHVVEKSLRGVICPHIDYDRGGPIYARTWDRAREAIAETDLFVIVGTDHAGSLAEITLTRQSFQTPFGILRTDTAAVDAVASAVGETVAFKSELNHTVEHSIELAAVWLHHLVGPRDVRTLPVLCGSFHTFTEGKGRPGDIRSWAAAAGALREIASRERTLVIAAADLAHMGPSFGDPQPMTKAEKEALAVFDAEMLALISEGDREGFLDLLIREGDRQKVCGLPPIYLAMTILGDVTGEMITYAQCPAPAKSVVSVAGMLLY